MSNIEMIEKDLMTEAKPWIK